MPGATNWTLNVLGGEPLLLHNFTFLDTLWCWGYNSGGRRERALQHAQPGMSGRPRPARKREKPFPSSTAQARRLMARARDISRITAAIAVHAFGESFETAVGATKSNAAAILRKHTAKARAFRQRMRAAGWRPVRIWVPDTRAEGFAAKCAAQAAAIAPNDPAGDELQSFIDAAYEWPKA